MFRKFFNALLGPFALLRRPRRNQAAALCWRMTEAGDEPEILLITTRRSGRWTPPKGSMIEGLTASEAAAQEAWEEAGVRGEVEEKPIGAFAAEKMQDEGFPEPLTILVYPLRVTELAEDFPEAGQRKLKWFARAKAAENVDEPGLRRLIQSFAPPQSP